MQQRLKCPVNRMKPCIGWECAWFTKSIKTKAQTQEPITLEVCAMVMIPDMLMDVIKNTNGTQAAVESSRNETVKRQDSLLGLLDVARRKAIGDPT